MKILILFVFLAISCVKDVPTNLPGVGTIPKDLDQSFKDKYKRESIAKKEFTNRLFLETSPYLLQHAHNPVNWYPWSEEAFRIAKNKNKPVFLSVGYSTCHWCHVMEEESFMDKEIAKFLNENFISIKVDREERPDVDAVYMSAVQAMTGRGGWPMSVWLDFNKNPFYAGTYFPARDGDREGRLGFLTVLKNIKKAYDSKTQKILESSALLTEQISKYLAPKVDIKYKFNLKSLDALYEEAKNNFDKKNGGFTGSPKFPSSFPNKFLMRYYALTNKKESLNLALKTLKKMALGGIFDQVEGGFHRYSVDEKWLVPHFEKMLYDNALLVPLYIEAFLITQDEFYKKVAMRTLNFLKNNFLENNLFYSAIDADSFNDKAEKEEGYYYTFSLDEIKSNTSKNLLKKLAATEEGNFESKNIIHFNSLKDFKSFESKIDKFLEIRRKKKKPFIDKKSITSWNSLAIEAFLIGGFYLNQQEYLDIGYRALENIMSKLFKTKRLFRISINNQIKQDGFLDDYSYLLSASLYAFQFSGEQKYYDFALKLNDILDSEFWDDIDGGYFYVSKDQRKLIADAKPRRDNAIPSGNSIQAMNLLRLYSLTTDIKYFNFYKRLMEYLGNLVKASPLNVTELINSLAYKLADNREIIITKGENFEKNLNILKKYFMPFHVIIIQNGANLKTLEGKKSLKDKSTVYICQEGICELPISDSKFLEKKIKEIN